MPVRSKIEFHMWQQKNPILNYPELKKVDLQVSYQIKLGKFNFHWISLGRNLSFLGHWKLIEIGCTNFPPF